MRRVSEKTMESSQYPKNQIARRDILLTPSLKFAAVNKQMRVYYRRVSRIHIMIRKIRAKEREIPAMRFGVHVSGDERRILRPN